jgi:hypothetical protein
MDTVKIATRAGWWEYKCLLNGQQTFTTHGALRGERQSYATSYGRLPAEHASALRSAESNGTLTYVVYSYATPIAWCAAGEWTMPDTRYSATTSHHQGKIGTAISQLTARHCA